MRKAVRAIVIKQDKLLVMKRDKFGHEYYTLVGGHIEPGETPEQALLRELFEETGVNVKNLRQVYIEHASLPYGDQLVYVCDYVSGEPKLKADSDESLISQMGQNLYLPMWIPVADLSKLSFRTKQLAENIIKHNHDGFPETVLEFSSKIE